MHDCMAISIKTTHLSYHIFLVPLPITMPLVLTRALMCVMAAPATGVPVSEMGDKYAQDTFALKDLISEYVSLVRDPIR